MKGPELPEERRTLIIKLPRASNCSRLATLDTELAEKPVTSLLRLVRLVVVIMRRDDGGAWIVIS